MLKKILRVSFQSNSQQSQWKGIATLTKQEFATPCNFFMTVSGSINRYNEIDTNLKRFKFLSCFPYETGTDLSCVIISLIILLSSTQLYSVLFFSNLRLGRKETKKKMATQHAIFVANFSDDFPLQLTDTLLTIFNVREKEILFDHPLTLYLHCFPYYC